MRTVLLWGLAEDAPLAAVREALETQGAPLVFVDHRRFQATTISMHFHEGVSGEIAHDDVVTRVEEIGGLYLRPYDFREFPELDGLDSTSAEWRQAATLDELMWTWAELADGVVVNSPSAMISNNSKPFQLDLIRSMGFAVPDTLLTTSWRAVESFARRHGQVVYKSISGQRSIVTRLTPVDRLRREQLRWCPTQFQQWIPGDDVRVHVAGDALFATRVVSDDDDYRYGDSEMQPEVLPCALASRCRHLVAALRLRLAGIDLRQTPDGKWYCFEVNPSPAFTAYEARTAQPIARAVAELLTSRL